MPVRSWSGDQNPETSTSDRVATTRGEILASAAESVGDLWLPPNLAHLREPLAAWLRDERHAVEDDPHRYCGAALDMARAILKRR